MFLLKLEVIFFFLSFFYILYYFIERFYISYKQVKNVVSSQGSQKVKKTGKKVNLEKKQIAIKKHKLSESQKEKLSEIIKKVKVHTTKGYLDSAKNCIVEGLAIDKNNKDLNLELAEIYKKEKNYKNAEYIYRDLIGQLSDDFEVSKKLAFILAMQQDFSGSIEIYESIHKNHPSDNEVIEMLADLSYNLAPDKRALKYISLYLKEKPRNVEKMFMKCECLEGEKKPEEAKKVYMKILELQPYNTRARDALKAFVENA